MDITFSHNLADFFNDAHGKKTWQHIVNSLPIWINQHDTRIKPIYLDLGVEHLYEIKIKKATSYYRMAYSYHTNQIHCFYIDKQLVKRKFETNLKKFLKDSQQLAMF